MEQINRVEGELNAASKQHQQAIQQNPKLESDGKYNRGQVELLDSLMGKFEKMKDLNPYEKASLTTMKAQRGLFAKKASILPDLNVRKRAAQAATWIFKKIEQLGGLLRTRVNNRLKRTTRRTLLGKGVTNLTRLLVNITGFLLQKFGRFAQWSVRKLARQKKAEAPAPKPQTNKQATSVNDPQKQNQNARLGQEQQQHNAVDNRLGQDKTNTKSPPPGIGPDQMLRVPDLRNYRRQERIVQPNPGHGLGRSR